MGMLLDAMEILEIRLRSFTVGKTSQEDYVTETIRKGEGGQLFLQRLGVVGWSFYKLIPRYHTVHPKEAERDRRSRVRRRR